MKDLGLLDNIPRELVQLDQWVGFRVIGHRKTPLVADAPTRKASSTDPACWRPYAVAVEALRQGSFHAIAFALNGDFIGIDLDDCLTDGTLSPRAADIVGRCASYTERSISGRGVHIMLAGPLPGGRGRRLTGIEIYTRARFFIVTGDRLADAPTTIRSNTEAISYVLDTATEQFEHSEVISSPPLSLPLSELIQRTTPQRAGQRNAMLLTLARGLRFNLGMDGRPLRDLRSIVRQWHAAALPFIRTKEFDETWADFIHAWQKARFALGEDVLSVAWENALRDPPPAVVEQYDSAPVRRLVCLCAALARPPSEGTFFLSTRDAGRVLGVDPKTANLWLNMLVADEVLSEVRKGDQFKATRFRWTATSGNSGCDSCGAG